jgi:hypothetical protein
VFDLSSDKRGADEDADDRECLHELLEGGQLIPWVHPAQHHLTYLLDQLSVEVKCAALKGEAPGGERLPPGAGPSTCGAGIGALGSLAGDE